MSISRELKRLGKKIDRKLPDGWRYYTQVFTGLLLILASLGSFIAPPTSIIAGITYFLTALYVIPDIRYRILFKLDIQEPRHSVIAVLVIGLMIASIALPPEDGEGAMSENQGFEVVSKNLDVSDANKSKFVNATAEVINHERQPRDYSLGLEIGGDVVETRSVTLEGGESRSFELVTNVEERGDQAVDFYSSNSSRPSDLDESGFLVEKTVNVPYYLNKGTVRNVVTSYSVIPQKNMNNIQEIDIDYGESGRTVFVSSKIGVAYDIFDLVKKASSNSYFASKEIYQNFERVDKVETEMLVNYTHPNGSVETRTVMNTSLESEDAQTVDDWSKKTSDFRTNFRTWLDLASSYSVREDICKSLSTDIECTKNR